MAERYERRAIGQTWSSWDQIFQNPMATAAAIDPSLRILELMCPATGLEKPKAVSRN